MRIGGVNDILKTYNQKKVQNRSNVREAFQKKDETTVSGEGRIYSRALNAAKKAPEVREAKIEALRTEIRSGNYNINAEDIAEKMLEDRLFDRRG